MSLPADPKDYRAIDLMLQIPGEDNSAWYESMKPLLRDEESRSVFKMPAQYMFKDIPGEIAEGVDAVAVTLDNMDRYGVEKGLINVGSTVREEPRRAIREHPGRFLGMVDVDPREGMDAVRKIRQYHDEYGIVAVSSFPAGYMTPINAAAYYPVYATCVELGLPIFLTAGVPGPRVPLAAQKVELLDEICWFFPELKVVMRHGADPWTELAVKLMLKWPNLYYSTSAFAPKHYPKAIIDYANTRGSDKIIYAGYYPMGLSLDRIFSELPNVGLNDDVWPKFLRTNALRVLGLDG
jgi:predicted TIM-barrel fold metal-dependent hydrolase